MSAEGHAGFKNGRPRTGKVQFHLRVNDSRFDETNSFLTNEQISDGEFDTHYAPSQPASVLRHLLQVHLIVEHIILQI